MGAWGTGLFSDDVACDVRAEFRALTKQCSVAEATKQILRRWQEALEDEEDGPVIWLALASLQCDHGGLQSRVKTKALKIIANGADLDRWQATGNRRHVSQRRTVLRKLKEMLESPQPASKRRASPSAKSRQQAASKKKLLRPIDWQVGEVVAYRLRSKDWILLHVFDINDNGKKVDHYPDVAILDWRGRDIPPAEQIMRMGYWPPPETVLAFGGDVATLKERRAYCISVAHRDPSHIPRTKLQRLSITKPLSFTKPKGWFPGVLWRLLDEQLQADLGLK